MEFRNLIVATGARERFLPFPGWTLPGVMGVGGLHALVKGGLDLFADRPLFGFGSGSFQTQYKLHRSSSASDSVSASHTIPITIAAEQGLLGLALYIALLLACFGRLFGDDPKRSPARVAIAAAFAGLVLHTMFYADFLEDPITWTLLGVGTSIRERLR